jgi:hypothetical protein
MNVGCGIGWNIVGGSSFKIKYNIPNLPIIYQRNINGGATRRTAIPLLASCKYSNKASIPAAGINVSGVKLRLFA